MERPRRQVELLTRFLNCLRLIGEQDDLPIGREDSPGLPKKPKV
jgi:hypothetical protein